MQAQNQNQNDQIDNIYKPEDKNFFNLKNKFQSISQRNSPPRMVVNRDTDIYVQDKSRFEIEESSDYIGQEGDFGSPGNQQQQFKISQRN